MHSECQAIFVRSKEKNKFQCFYLDRKCKSVRLFVQSKSYTFLEKKFNYKMSIPYNFFSNICIFYRSKWKVDQNHKKNIFRTLVAIQMKLDTFIGIFITNLMEQFWGLVVNIVTIYRPECKFKFWFVNLSMIYGKTQTFGIW